MNLEKKLQKSRLGEAYAGIHSDADRQAVLRAYDCITGISMPADA